jgi:hypothetical protein
MDLFLPSNAQGCGWEIPGPFACKVSGYISEPVFQRALFFPRFQAQQAG